MLDEPRSAETRQRAETALIRLLHGLGEKAPRVTVLGGLVPAVLTEDVEGAPPHLGTADVDVLLITHLDETASLEVVEASLARMKFAPTNEEGWRWRGDVDGYPVRIEFLCDLDSVREGEFVSPPGCTRLAASNLRGTGFVGRDCSDRTLRGTLPDGSRVEVTARFAGLGGYLLSKLVAVRTRAAAKDYYDFVYVLINNPEGGPGGAAQVLLREDFSDALAGLQSSLLEVRARFGSTSDYGPQRYAEQAEQANPGEDSATLRADAVAAAREFFALLCDR